jgi:hypothetical protein
MRSALIWGETQRQWSDLAILRTTPALLGLFSLVVVFAHQLLQGQPLPVRQAAWYTKALPTFSDTLAFVRQHLWPVTLSYLSPAKPDIVAHPPGSFRALHPDARFCCLIWIKSSLEAGVKEVIALGSEKRFSEAFDNYQDMRLIWQKEQRVKALADIFAS